MSMNKMKAQTAMEYLMTYGWAILIVIIVGAALYALGIFNPSTYTTSVATGFTGFQVPTGGYAVNSTGVHILVKNAQGATINITNVVATVNGVTTTALIPEYALLSSNGQSWFSASGGVTLPISGSSYTVQVAIDFTFVDTGVAAKSTGTITGTVA